jgi:phosphate transport system protein
MRENSMEKEHTDRRYRENLQKLRERLLRMAGRVEEMIARSVESLVDQNVELARQVIESDNRVNRDEIETDELCLIILAKWQPVATDLRFITLALKMVTDLERIGDLAVNICERTIVLGSDPPIKPYVDIPRMAEIVQAMIRDAVDAFVEGNAEKAWAVIERDDVVDDLYRKVFRDLLNLMRQDEANVERGIRVQSVAKVLERMADHTTNLAEHVIFLVKGEDVRHIGKLGKQ